jgi:hypothetical protein
MKLRNELSIQNVDTHCKEGSIKYRKNNANMEYINRGISSWSETDIHQILFYGVLWNRFSPNTIERDFMLELTKYPHGKYEYLYRTNPPAEGLEGLFLEEYIREEVNRKL